MHGDIGYKFCWLLPSEDHNQGTPAGHESNGTIVRDHWEDIASRALSWKPRVAHLIHIPELFLASRALSWRYDVVYVNNNLYLFIQSKDLSLWPKGVYVIHYPKLFITSIALSSWPRMFPIIDSDSCPIGVSADLCSAGAPWLRE